LVWQQVNYWNHTVSFDVSSISALFVCGIQHLVSWFFLCSTLIGIVTLQPLSPLHGFVINFLLFLCVKDQFSHQFVAWSESVLFEFVQIQLSWMLIVARSV